MKSRTLRAFACWQASSVLIGGPKSDDYETEKSLYSAQTSPRGVMPFAPVKSQGEAVPAFKDDQPSFSDLSLREIGEIVSRFLKAFLVVALIAIPFVAIWAGGSHVFGTFFAAQDSWPWAIRVVLTVGIVLLWLIFGNVPFALHTIGSQLFAAGTYLEKQTRTRRAFLVCFFAFFIWLSVHYFAWTMMLTFLIGVPLEIAHAKYKELLQLRIDGPPNK